MSNRMLESLRKFRTVASEAVETIDEYDRLVFAMYGAENAGFAESEKYEYELKQLVGDFVKRIDERHKELIETLGVKVNAIDLNFVTGDMTNAKD